MGLDPISMIAIGLGVSGAATAASSALADSPEAPDYGAASREGILTDIETLPLRRMIEQAARLGTKVTYNDPRTGEEKTADFTGFGDLDFAAKELEYTLGTAEKIAETTLNLQQKYGPDFIKQRIEELKLADPTGFAAREEMGATILEELRRGTELSPEMREQVIEAEREAQASRGNVLGTSSGAAEALSVGEAGYRLYQQRLANAASFLSGTTPVAQFAQISGAQQGPVAFQTAGITGGTNINPNAGTTGTQFALQTYAQQSANAANSPWASLLGSIAGAGTGLAGLGAATPILEKLLKR